MRRERIEEMRGWSGEACKIYGDDGDCLLSSCVPAAASGKKSEMGKFGINTLLFW